MKKAIAFVLTLVCVLVLVGCGKQAQQDENVFKGNMKTYRKLDDGTWECEEYTYQYRLEITGRMHDAAADTTFVYLSNLETITFEQAYRAAGYSSNADDYFLEKDAVLVDVILHK